MNWRAYIPDDLPTAAALVCVALFLLAMTVLRPRPARYRGIRRHAGCEYAEAYPEPCRLCYRPLGTSNSHTSHAGTCCSCHHGGDFGGAA